MCRKSCVNVIDAKTMSAEPVAVVELPHRVPYGFHALFVTEVLNPLPIYLLFTSDASLTTSGSGLHRNKSRNKLFYKPSCVHIYYSGDVEYY